MDLTLVPGDADGALPHGVTAPAGGLGLDDVAAKMHGAARRWVVVGNGEAVGLACFFDDGSRPEIGYGVSPAHRGRGLAKDIVANLQALARGGGRDGLCARTARNNPASGAVLAACGFAETGETDEPGAGRVRLWSWNT